MKLEWRLPNLNHPIIYLIVSKLEQIQFPITSNIGFLQKFELLGKLLQDPIFELLKSFRTPSLNSKSKNLIASKLPFSEKTEFLQTLIFIIFF